MSNDVNSAIWHGYIIACGAVNDKYDRMLKGVCKKYGLNICESKILICLYYSHKPHTLRYLTDATNYSKGMVSRSVESLLNKELISIEQDEFDKRALRVTLCKSALEFLEESDKKRLEFSEKIFSGLNDVELKQLNHLITVMYDNVKKI